jgi:hypothetical protein
VPVRRSCQPRPCGSLRAPAPPACARCRLSCHAAPPVARLPRPRSASHSPAPHSGRPPRGRLDPNRSGRSDGPLPLTGVQRAPLRRRQVPPPAPVWMAAQNLYSTSVNTSPWAIHRIDRTLDLVRAASSAGGHLSSSSLKSPARICARFLFAPCWSVSFGLPFAWYQIMHSTADGAASLVSGGTHSDMRGTTSVRGERPSRVRVSRFGCRHRLRHHAPLSGSLERPASLEHGRRQSFIRAAVQHANGAVAPDGPVLSCRRRRAAHLQR